MQSHGLFKGSSGWVRVFDARSAVMRVKIDGKRAVDLNIHGLTMSAGLGQLLELLSRRGDVGYKIRGNGLVGLQIGV